LVINSAGSSSAYILGFLLSPILARIYQPEAYGLYALFNAFVASLSIVATLNYVNAFVLPRSNKEFISLFQLAIISTAVAVLLSTVIICFFNSEILQFFNARNLEGLIYLVPAVVLFTGINRCLSSWNVRAKEFKQGAKAKIYSTVGAKLLTIGYGVASLGSPIGFVFGDLLTQPLTTYSLLSKSIKKNWPEIYKFSFRRIFQVAIEYRSYPLYNLPSSTLIVLSTQLPIYLFSLYFTPAIAGHFSLSISLISAPTQLLGIAFAQVFFQKATETFQKSPHELAAITLKYFRRLIYVGAFPFALIAVFGDLMFITIFGPNWQLAGNFASYLSLMAYMTFLATSISSLFRVLRREKLQFYITFLGSCLLVIGLIISLSFHSSHYLVITYSVVTASLQVGLMAIAFKITGIGVVRMLVYSTSVLFILILCMYTIRQVWPLMLG
jgi:O-antigen/teichoic acid export membrane protein